MFKRNIKIILVGFFSLILMVLAYGLLGNSPEIISDESLRVEEPIAPKLKAQIESNPVAPVPLMSSDQIESSLEAKLIDQPVASYREDLIVSTEDVDVIVADAVELESPFQKDAVQRFQMDNKKVGSSEDYLAFDDVDAGSTIIASEDSFGESFEQKSDVAIIPDSSEFLDLNLEEKKPEQEMVLVEGDQLIVDDINDSLIEQKTANSEVVTINDKFASAASSIPSVFAVPDIDEDLMAGDSEISEQYRNTMSKLISINAKLRKADEENVQLQRQFEMSVLNNQQLAQIIRDIDDQIKAFTLTN